MFPAGNGTTGWMYDSKDGSPIPEMKDGDMHCAATGGYSRILRYGQPSGMYTLKLKPMEGGAKTGFGLLSVVEAVKRNSDFTWMLTVKN